MSLESSEGLLDAMGSQALSGGVYHSPEAIAQKIDSVSATDVANVSLFTLGRILSSAEVEFSLTHVLMSIED